MTARTGTEAVEAGERKLAREERNLIGHGETAVPVIRALISALPTPAALSVPVDLLRFFQIYDFRPVYRGDRNSSSPPPCPSFHFFFIFNRLSLFLSLFLSRKRERELSSHRVNSAPDMRN